MGLFLGAMMLGLRKPRKVTGVGDEPEVKITKWQMEGAPNTRYAEDIKDIVEQDLGLAEAGIKFASDTAD